MIQVNVYFYRGNFDFSHWLHPQEVLRPHRIHFLRPAIDEEVTQMFGIGHIIRITLMNRMSVKPSGATCRKTPQKSVRFLAREEDIQFHLTASGVFRSQCRRFVGWSDG
jgi:hypothetical protein